MSDFELTKPDHTPLIESLLTLPEQGADGSTAICSNTMAGGQVLNELGEPARNQVPIIGTLIVSKDGAERMILNSLIDPTVRTVVLFAEEAQSFAPASNLLLALMNGMDTQNGSNKIVGGLGSAANYPNLNTEILDAFRENITVLPLYTSKRPTHDKILEKYLEWLKGRTPREVTDFLENNSQRSKIYFDKLNDILELLSGRELPPKPTVELDSQTYKNLQPPKIEVPPTDEKPKVEFSVSRSGSSRIQVDLQLQDGTFKLHGNDEFELSYSLMKILGERKSELSPLEQLLLGAELGRAGAELRSDFELESFVTSTISADGTQLELLPIENPKMDKDFYYRISVRDGELSVLCLANDNCEEVFDLRSSSVVALLKRLAELNRFEEYEMDILHRLDIGAQIGRAGVAAKYGLNFMQDFPLVFRENTTDFPLAQVVADTFLGVHKNTLIAAYTEGLSERHADEHKGPARSLGVLAVYRTANTALAVMPKIYQQGVESTEKTRADYRDQLLRRDHDGDYSYGERTQVHFGVDQLKAASEALKNDGTRAFVVQRYDPVEDMSFEEDESGKRHYSHDPCLTHDIYWVSGNGKLQSLHIARAHNLVNAYPDNIFGLHDAYATRISAETRLELGDMFVLSSRGNVLLLTEEQQLQKIVAEPSKPNDPELDQSSGPIDVDFYGKTVAKGYLAHEEVEMKSVLGFYSKHPILQSLGNYQGVDLIDKAAQYLSDRGMSHNNPIMSTYQPGRSNPQAFSMPFLQANVFGGQLQTTAVLVNPRYEHLEDYRNICRYVAIKIADRLSVPIAKMNLIYVPLDS